MVLMKVSTEKNMDDFVYEDAYYEEVLKNHENIDSQMQESQENQEDDPVNMIVVCDDCTHQWEEEKISGGDSPFCPMCGSIKVIII
jgi:Zn finger protein HypA/HybF involved in hydrogenase expression